MINLYSNPFIEGLKNLEKDQIILVHNKESFTAYQIFNEAVEIAKLLKESGLHRGSKAVFILPPGKKFLTAFYASMMIGSTISIIDPEMGNDNYRNKFRQFDPDYIFIDSRLLFLQEHPLLKYLLKKTSHKNFPDIPFSKNMLVFSCGMWMPVIRKSKFIKVSKTVSPSDVVWNNDDPARPFLITYTSGTLGSPKGVVHSIHTISCSMGHLKNLLNTDGTVSIATHLPQYMLLGIVSGKKIYLWNNEWSGEKKGDFLVQNKITTLFGPPNDFIALLNYLRTSGRRLNVLKNIYLGSAPVYPNFLQYIHQILPDVAVQCLYGMTENLLVSMINSKKKLEYTGKGDIVGQPFEGVEILINSEHEITLRSPQLFLEYYKHSFPDNFYATGDLGFIDNDGNIVLEGRKKDMIIRKNFNIYPSLYEPTIHKIPGVVCAALVGVYDQKIADEVVWLCIESSVKLNENHILQKLKTGEFSIDQEAIPDKIIFMPLPRTGRQQKVNKELIRKYITDNFY
jgi:acyl-CoA synthetase (AMP-forming)/AMP-acid ligase II